MLIEEKKISYIDGHLLGLGCLVSKRLATWQTLDGEAYSLAEVAANFLIITGFRL